MGGFVASISDPGREARERRAAESERLRQEQAVSAANAAIKQEQERLRLDEEARRTERQRRITGASTLVTDPFGLGGQAQTTRKILTGE